MPSTVPEPAAAPIAVAVAVIGNSRGEILIAQRSHDQHQGGLWEFPGGKIESGERVGQALVRECHEELGIKVTPLHRLLTINHRYNEREVILHCWRVNIKSGKAHGREGQPIAWVTPQQLNNYSFPVANRPIITWLQLPSCYLITPEPPASRRAWPHFCAHLGYRLANGIRMVQLRSKVMAVDDYYELATMVASHCAQHGSQLQLNPPPASDLTDYAPIAGAGYHLTADRLWQLTTKPVCDGWLSASCHNAADLQRAKESGVDFVVLSPVAATASHPEAQALGWPNFRQLIAEVALPVYALGGMQQADISTAQAAGGVGIAALGGLW
jgi:8-oxo-dGTP diphosphatase